MAAAGPRPGRTPTSVADEHPHEAGEKVGRLQENGKAQE